MKYLGVMLSHDNVYWTAMNIGHYVVKLKEKEEVGVSYLPLSHVAANLSDIWGVFLVKGTIVFADRGALKGTLGETLKEARPTSFFGVPRVYEKIVDGIQSKTVDAKGVKKKMFDFFTKAGLQYHTNKTNKLAYKAGKKLLYPKLHSAMGLDRCRSFYSGAAPIANETLEYLLGIDIEVSDTYGMSEAPSSTVVYKESRLGSVGIPIPGCKIQIHNPNENGEGEICMWGRNAMMGYLNEKEKTIGAIDNDGWIHSGDIGYIDADQYLYIRGKLSTIGTSASVPTKLEVKLKGH